MLLRSESERDCGRERMDGGWLERGRKGPQALYVENVLLFSIRGWPAPLPLFPKPL